MPVAPTSKPARMSVVPTPGRCGCRDPGSAVWWPFRIPGRIWFALVVIAAPFRAVALAMEMALTSCMLALVGTGWAWWTHRISDEDVAGVLGQAGERILSILGKSGILPGGGNG